jgi:hypothetical protein
MSPTLVEGLREQLMRVDHIGTDMETTGGSFDVGQHLVQVRPVATIHDRVDPDLHAVAISISICRHRRPIFAITSGWALKDPCQLGYGDKAQNRHVRNMT